MEELFYWIIEYCKVMFGFGFLMFIWPMVVFRKYLAGKSATFRFSFCVVEQLVLINTVVLVLGLAKLLNEWTIYILFYGTFLFSLRKHFALTKERRKKLRYLVNGSFGWRNFLFLERRKLVRSVEKFFKRLCEFYKKHWLEYTLLIVAIVYGMIYFTWGVFHEHSYPFSDMYVHHSWAYELSQGVPFSNGIYPQGLHCFIYSLSTLFGIRMYSCVLFMASANAAITLVAIYCLLKELFRWRFSAVFTLIAMLTFGEMGRYLLISMARFQCALPQEMAFSSIFICCLYLMKYLKGGRRAIRKGKETKGFWDENLLVFMLALAATIVFHFYATFMAFFMCVGVALFLWKRIFTKERFLPLITAVLFSLFISVAPMATGYATGIELEHSLLWAMSVMEESVESEEAGVQENISNAINTPDGTLTEEEGLNAGAETGGTSEKTPEVSIFEKIGKKLLSVGTAALNKCKYICSIIYTETYPEMYGPDVVVMILLTMGIVLFGGSIGAFFLFCVEKMKKVSIERPAYGGYFIIIYAALVYVLIYSSEFLGWPVLLERYRIGFICNLMNIAVVMISADILFCMGKRALEEQGLKIFSVGFSFGVVALIWIAGKYHGYLYFELTRYDATVQVTNQIIEDMPEKSYTIISPTEELYQMRDYGWHEELLDFVLAQEKDYYCMNSEYVFVFLEKRPFNFAQYHFHSGPQWLGYDRYQEIYGYTSTWPEYVYAIASDEMAERELLQFDLLSNNYTFLYPRTVLESRVYQWCKAFKEKYPNEFKTYYEDEYFVCYYWKQNPYKPFNLVIE